MNKNYLIGFIVLIVLSLPTIASADKYPNNKIDFGYLSANNLYGFTLGATIPFSMDHAKEYYILARVNRFNNAINPNSDNSSMISRTLIFYGSAICSEITENTKACFNAGLVHNEEQTTLHDDGDSSLGGFIGVNGKYYFLKSAWTDLNATVIQTGNSTYNGDIKLEYGIGVELGYSFAKNQEISTFIDSGLFLGSTTYGLRTAISF